MTYQCLSDCLLITKPSSTRGASSVFAEGPRLFSSTCRPTSVGSLWLRWVRRAGAIPTGRSCENAPGKAGATSASEVRRKKRVRTKAARLVAARPSRRSFITATCFYPVALAIILGAVNTTVSHLPGFRTALRYRTKIMDVSALTPGTCSALLRALRYRHRCERVIGNKVAKEQFINNSFQGNYKKSIMNN